MFRTSQKLLPRRLLPLHLTPPKPHAHHFRFPLVPLHHRNLHIDPTPDSTPDPTTTASKMSSEIKVIKTDKAGPSELSSCLARSRWL